MKSRGLLNRTVDIGGLYDLASIWARGKYMSDERVGNGVGRMIVYMLGTRSQLIPASDVNEGHTLKGRKSLRWHEG
jgi:hypothetical protein